MQDYWKKYIDKKLQCCLFFPEEAICLWWISDIERYDE